MSDIRVAVVVGGAGAGQRVPEGVSVPGVIGGGGVVGVVVVGHWLGGHVGGVQLGTGG